MTDIINNPDDLEILIATTIKQQMDNAVAHTVELVKNIIDEETTGAVIMDNSTKAEIREICNDMDTSSTHLDNAVIKLAHIVDGD